MATQPTYRTLAVSVADLVSMINHADGFEQHQIEVYRISDGYDADEKAAGIAAHTANLERHDALRDLLQTATASSALVLVA